MRGKHKEAVRLASEAEAGCDVEEEAFHEATLVWLNNRLVRFNNRILTGQEKEGWNEPCSSMNYCSIAFDEHIFLFYM